MIIIFKFSLAQGSGRPNARNRLSTLIWPNLRCVKDLKDELVCQSLRESFVQMANLAFNINK
jgi:hypothetical protein